MARDMTYSTRNNRVGPYNLGTVRALTNVAYRAGQQVRTMYDKYKKNKNKPKEKKKQKGKARVSGTVMYKGEGKFAGKFPKGKKKNLASQSMSKFARNGSIQVRETVGTVSDTDCVYLYSHNVVPADVMFLIASATVRKLLELAFKTKYTSTSNYVLMGNYNATLGSYLVVLTYYDAVTGANNSTVVSTISGTKLLIECADELGLVLNSYSSGNGTANAANPREPFLLSVYKRMDADSDSVLLATMNLHNEYIELYSSMELKVQNRSASASGSKDTDQVDSNPLQGYIYEFSSVPKSRDPLNVTGGTLATTDRAYDFASVRYIDGMNLVRGSDLPSGYREPITARNFTNCKGVSKVRLEPGCIKNLYRKYQKSINFVKFLHDYNLQVNALTSNGRVIKCLGGGVLIGFEDVINVNSSALITVTYEAERKSGVVLKTRGHTDITPQFIQSEFNNPEIIP